MATKQEFDDAITTMLGKTLSAEDIEHLAAAQSMVNEFPVAPSDIKTVPGADGPVQI